MEVHGDLQTHHDIFAEKDPMMLLHVQQFDSKDVSGTFEFGARHEKWGRLLLALPPLRDRRQSLQGRERTVPQHTEQIQV